MNKTPTEEAGQLTIHSWSSGFRVTPETQCKSMVSIQKVVPQNTKSQRL